MTSTVTALRSVHQRDMETAHLPSPSCSPPAHQQNGGLEPKIMEDSVCLPLNLCLTSTSSVDEGKLQKQRTTSSKSSPQSNSGSPKSNPISKLPGSSPFSPMVNKTKVVKPIALTPQIIPQTSFGCNASVGKLDLISPSIDMSCNQDINIDVVNVGEPSLDFPIKVTTTITASPPLATADKTLKRKAEIVENNNGAVSPATGHDEPSVGGKKKRSNDDAASESSETTQSELSIKTKEPSEKTLTYNLFVRHVVDNTLDRSVTFCEQPRNKISAIEAACSRQFPEFSEDQHRTKIRCYLKACRRNAKKQQNRASSREGVVVKDLCDYISAPTAMVPSPPATSGSSSSGTASYGAKARQAALEAWNREEDVLKSSIGLLQQGKSAQSRTTEDSLLGPTNLSSDRLKALVTSHISPAMSSTSSSAASNERILEMMKTNDTTSSSAGALPFSLFPFLPFPTSQLKENGGALAAGAASMKKNGVSEQKLGEFLQANFWCSVEMVKAMRLSAGFILMSAQKIEDALLADPALQSDPQTTSAGSTTTTTIT